MENKILENNNNIMDTTNEKQILNTENERNYGIDLLRIVSMFFVVILHCLGQGGD